MSIAKLPPLDARIPEWDMKNLSTRDCPFCKNKNATLIERPDALSAAFCSSCGCWYIDNIPSDSDITNVYDGYYNTYHPTDLSEGLVTQRIDDARIASKTNWQLHTLLKLYSGHDRMRILDVGCGYGEFLLEAKAAGADVVGCDLSPEACEFANNRLGIKVYHSDLAACSTSIGHIDAIVMRDLIEHTVSPLADIEMACSILKPGGLLLLYTPNGGEPGPTVDTAKEWVGFRVDLEHFQYLSPHTINWISQKLDLRIEHLETLDFPWIQRIDKLPQDESGKKQLAKKIALKIPGLLKTIRFVKSAISPTPPNLSLGSYRLLAILRKL